MLTQKNIMNRGSGSIYPNTSDTYELKFRDRYGNTISRRISRLGVLNRHYNDVAVIDVRNQYMQDLLG